MIELKISPSISQIAFTIYKHLQVHRLNILGQNHSSRSKWHASTGSYLGYSLKKHARAHGKRFSSSHTLLVNISQGQCTKKHNTSKSFSEYICMYVQSDKFSNDNYGLTHPSCNSTRNFFIRCMFLIRTRVVCTFIFSLHDSFYHFLDSSPWL